ncbi:unnamed protein product [Echinostoma caproni]|uniref:Uncharacterized protein n=1 Tax=Echinostoma caproni TaxID=27848 RepID=A0A183AFG7_9TREM|nr:unnamed protein product [Echinostoma caproni]
MSGGNGYCATDKIRNLNSSNKPDGVETGSKFDTEPDATKSHLPISPNQSHMQHPHQCQQLQQQQQQQLQQKQLQHYHHSHPPTNSLQNLVDTAEYAQVQDDTPYNPRSGNTRDLGNFGAMKTVVSAMFGDENDEDSEEVTTTGADKSVEEPPRKFLDHPMHYSSNSVGRNISNHSVYSEHSTESEQTSGNPFLFNDNSQEPQAEKGRLSSGKQIDPVINITLVG